MSYIAQMQSMGVVKPQGYQERYGISQEAFTQIQQRAGQTAANTMRPQATVQEPADQNQLTLAQSQTITKITEALQYQAVQFERFRELTERKFTTLSKDLMDVTMQLKDAHTVIARLRDRHDVAAAREQLQSYQRGDRPATDRPIDRNGVAPSKVQIQDIFNCSGRRF